MFLIEIPSLSDPQLAEQDAQLELLDAESLRLRFIVACPKGRAFGRYHTLPQEAERLRGSIEGFRASLLGAGAELLYQADSPISAKEIEALLQ